MSDLLGQRDPDALAAPEVQAIQARTVRVMVSAQAFGGLALTVAVAVTTVLARDVSGSESLAGLAQTLQVLGAAVAAYLLARISSARGRRTGVVTGYAAGGLGAATCVAAGAVGSFALLLVGCLLLGATGASTYQARYVAADLALPARRGRALATVMWATTVGAVLGPNLVGPAGDLARSLDLPALTGPFLMSVAISAIAGTIVFVRLRPDPLHVARQVAGGGAGQGPRAGGWRQTWEVARTRPTVGAAVVAVSAAHAVMIAVMVMTPLHMDHGGAELELIGFVISIHVLGMFLFSPVMGWLADRLGRAPVLYGGGSLLLLACVVTGLSPEGASFAIGLGLFLLGLGWSATTVAGSALLTDATPVDQRAEVQGTSDLLMNAAAAVAAVLGGVVVGTLGFAALNVFAATLVLGVLWAAEVARRQRDTDLDGVAS